MEFLYTDQVAALATASVDAGTMLAAVRKIRCC